MEDDGTALSEASPRVLARAGGGLGPGDAQARAGGRPRSGGLHRTGAPVLRDSIEAGTFEDVFFAMPAPGEPNRLLTACRRARDAGRRLAREARGGGRGPYWRPNAALLR